MKAMLIGARVQPSDARRQRVPRRDNQDWCGHARSPELPANIESIDRTRQAEVEEDTVVADVSRPHDGVGALGRDFDRHPLPAQVGTDPAGKTRLILDEEQSHEVVGGVGQQAEA